MLRKLKQRTCSQDKTQYIRFKRQNEINEQKGKKNKSVDETLKIISITSKVDKRKSSPKPEKSIAKRVKLRRQRLNTIEEKEKK